MPIRTEREAPAIEENIIDEVTEENVVTTVTEGAVSWVSAGGGAVPEGSLVGGNDHGEEIIVARAAFEGALLPGKLVAAHGVAYVPWGGEEHGLEEYEVRTPAQLSHLKKAGQTKLFHFSLYRLWSSQLMLFPGFLQAEVKSQRMPFQEVPQSTGRLFTSDVFPMRTL